MRGIPGDPPCDTCNVELLAGNKTAVEIYMMCRSQCVTRFNGERDFEIDLDLPAVESVMRMRGIPFGQQWGLLNRVRKLFFQLKKEDEGE